MSYARYAIYYVPCDDVLADFGAAWLGWDVMGAQDVPQMTLAGLHDITVTPRKYGFHATLKPPFRPLEGVSLAEIKTATARLAASRPAAVCAGLELRALGRFLALTPRGDGDAIRDLAAACVRDLDRFRAPATEFEIARRRAGGLSAEQDALLMQWGYPYVMDAFQFHMTLTDRLVGEDMQHWQGVLQTHLPPLPAPFRLDQIALCGERFDGQFEVIHRYTLSG